MEKKKKSQSSRKGTKAWRKNIDITDIEEHLESKVKEQMEGGPISEREDIDLFTIDTAGSISKHHQRIRNKTLRIDEILAERSAIPAIGSSAKSAGKKKEKVKKKELSKSQLILIKKKLQQSQLAKSPKDKPSAEVEIDAWAPVPSVPIEQQSILKKVDSESQEFIKDFLPKPVKLPDTRKIIPPVAKSLPAVEISHPGTSYNPDPELHKQAVEMAAEIEMNRLKNDEIVKKTVGDNLNVIMACHNLSADATMEVDLPSEDEEEGEDGQGGDDIGKPSKSKKELRKKTRTERNREKRIRQQELALQQRREEEKIRKQLLNVKKYENEVDQKQNDISKRKAERVIITARRKATQPAKLSRHPYKPLFPTVQLSEDLPDSLRQLKPEGNLFKALYNSLEKRNIIESRVPVAFKRRYKQKEYEKHSYKRFK